MRENFNKLIVWLAVENARRKQIGAVRSRFIEAMNDLDEGVNEVISRAP